MKRILALIFAAILAFILAYAQNVPIANNASGTITATSSSCTATSCVYIVLPVNTSTASIQLSGTFSATVQFESSVNNSTWASITSTGNASSSTSAGIFNFCVYGQQYLRARASAYSSGSALVNITSAIGGNSCSGGGGGSGITGLNQDVNASGTGTVAATVVQAQDGAILFNSDGSASFGVGSTYAAIQYLHTGTDPGDAPGTVGFMAPTAAATSFRWELPTANSLGVLTSDGTAGASGPSQLSVQSYPALWSNLNSATGEPGNSTFTMPSTGMAAYYYPNSAVSTYSGGTFIVWTLPSAASYTAGTPVCAGDPLLNIGAWDVGAQTSQALLVLSPATSQNIVWSGAGNQTKYTLSKGQQVCFRSNGSASWIASNPPIQPATTNVNGYALAYSSPQADSAGAVTQQSTTFSVGQLTWNGAARPASSALSTGLSCSTGSVTVSASMSGSTIALASGGTACTITISEGFPLQHQYVMLIQGSTPTTSITWAVSGGAGVVNGSTDQTGTGSPTAGQKLMVDCMLDINPTGASRQTLCTTLGGTWH